MKSDSTGIDPQTILQALRPMVIEDDALSLVRHLSILGSLVTASLGEDRRQVDAIGMITVTISSDALDDLDFMLWRAFDVARQIDSKVSALINTYCDLERQLPGWPNLVGGRVAA